MIHSTVKVFKKELQIESEHDKGSLEKLFNHLSQCIYQGVKKRKASHQIFILRGLNVDTPVHHTTYYYFVNFIINFTTFGHNYPYDLA